MTWGCFFLLSCGFGMLIDNLNSDEAMSDSGGIHGRALSIPLPSLALLHELATRAELMGLPSEGQGDLVNSLVIPINHIVTRLVIPNIDLLTTSP